MTSVELAQASNGAIYATMISLTLAMVCFAASFALGSRRPASRPAAERGRRERGWRGRHHPHRCSRRCRRGPWAPRGEHRHGADVAVLLDPHRRRRSAGNLGRPGPVGQHVRVLDHGGARDPGCLPHHVDPARPSLARALHRDPGSAHSWDGRHRPLHRGGPAGPGPEVLLARHPRFGRGDLLRSLHPGRGHRGAVARPLARRATGGSGCRSGWTARLPSRGPPSSAHQPRRRLHVPALDLRRGRRCHLGRERLGSLLGLGSEGDAGPSSPGSSSPPTCTPGRRPGGAATARPGSSSAAGPRS